MQLRFTKMHGLGNDFVVFDAIRQTVALTPDQVRLIADRRFGIGCDQLLLVERPTLDGVDFRYRIFNADGGEVEQCGNGARCFARFVHDQGLTDKQEIRVETAGGPITLYLEANGEVRVNMGEPRFAPEAIPFRADAAQLDYSLDAGGKTVTVGVVSMGNPHAVIRVADVASAPVETQGPAVQAHERFPQGVNVGFMQVIAPDHIRLRVYERGSGETLACGTGACAAAVAGRRWGLLDATVRVDLPGGTLTIRWDEEGEPVWMTGPATRVFEGTIEL